MTRVRTGPPFAVNGSTWAGLPVVWVPIKQIMQDWDSIDLAYAEDELMYLSNDPEGSPYDGMTAWEAMLEMKRGDDQYQDVVDSVRDKGLLIPFQAIDRGHWIAFGDGHHRLAACIDLGYTEVPVVPVQSACTTSPWSGWGEDEIPVYETVYEVRRLVAANYTEDLLVSN